MVLGGASLFPHAQEGFSAGQAACDEADCDQQDAGNEVHGEGKEEGLHGDEKARRRSQGDILRGRHG